MFILLFIIVLAILVLAHEAGHFFAARRFGMRVDEFGFGFPPRAKAWVRKSGLVLSLNWLPLGGFVKIKGEDGAHEHDHDSFAHKKAWQRLIVLVAGVAMNFVLAAVLLSFGFAAGLPSIVDEYTPASARVRNVAVHVMSVLPESPAAAAGLEAGDRVVSVGGQIPVDDRAVRAMIGQQGELGVELVWERANGEQKTAKIVATDLKDVGVRGIGVGLATTGLVSFPAYEAIYRGALATVSYTVEFVRTFGLIVKNLATGHGPGVELSGPVGIAAMTGDIARLGWVYLLQFTAVLSINLGVLNILPIPALDGGRVLFLAIEKVLRRRVGGRTEALVHNVGFVLLMMLIILVTYRDVVKVVGSYGS